MKNRPKQRSFFYQLVYREITKNRDPGVWSIDPKNTLCKMGGDDGHKMVITLGDLTILG